MARTFPGIDNKADEKEWDRLMHEVSRIDPLILKEMWVPPEEMRAMLFDEGLIDPKLAAFRADGPILSAHMQAFAAKVGFALRYEDRGQPVPEGGAVQVRWFTSTELINEQLPESLYESVGEIEIMRQGKITSDGTFEYGWGNFSEKPEVKLYYAKARKAFAVAAFVADERATLPFSDEELATFVPGDLSQPPFDRILDL